MPCLNSQYLARKDILDLVIESIIILLNYVIGEKSMVKMLFFDLKESERKYFEENDTSDFEITLYKENLTDDTKLSVRECEETAIVSVYTCSKITKKVLDKFKNIRVIAIRSNGYENIDIQACRSRNIAVMNISDSENISVAQYVMGVIFMLARNINKAVYDFKTKINRYEEYEGRDISKLSIGVIGTGVIGASVCKIAHKMDMKIYAYDIMVNRNLTNYVEYLSLIDVLRKSDIITLHIPYNRDLYHFISEKEFNIMKENSILINTSHGDLVDTRALYKAIKNNRIKGVALDVIECENKYYDSSFNYFSNLEEAEILLLLQELLTEQNVIITPRISQNTTDSTDKKLDITFMNIKDFYKGRHTNRVD